MHLAESEVDIYTTFIRLMTINTVYPYNKASHTKFLESQTRALKSLDAHLASNTFFVGERLTLADIFVAAITLRAVANTVDAPARASLVNLVRHLETVANQDKIKDIFGKIEYIEKGIAFVPPAKEAKAPKAPAAPAAPKAPKEKKPAAKDDDDDEEPLVPAEPKAKNPLDDLPKSSLNLEDWKRAYSNKDTRGADGALEWFYANNDTTGYSVWRVDFKYPTELTQTFMSSNLIGGFFNRLEASRKYLFGSMGVLGKTNDSLISGALIARGQDIKPVVDVAPDYESYEFTKLDPNNADDKAFVESMWKWDKPINYNGKEYTHACGKVIK